MEEKNDIVLAGGDALVYLAGPMHKKYYTKFVWGQPFSTYVSYDRFFNPLPLVRICSHLGVTPFCVCDFIDLILSSPILTLFVCHSFLILLYLRNSRIDDFVSDIHHFLASHSVSSSLPRKAFSLMITVSYFTFHDR